MDDQSDKISRLEDRIEQLEATIAKMLPGRRDAMKLGGAAVLGAAAMSGTASAGSSQVGTIGDVNSLVDIEAEDVTINDTLNGASISGAAQDEALLSDGAGGLTFAEAGGGIPPNFSYNDVANSRSFDTTFTNNTGKAIYLTVVGEARSDTNRIELELKVGSDEIQRFRPQTVNFPEIDTNYQINVSGFVPAGSDYRVNEQNVDLVKWYEAEM